VLKTHFSAVCLQKGLPRCFRPLKTKKGVTDMTNLTLEEKKELIRMALAAREKAYVPYSDFMVGAALRAKDGRIFTGCNVENAAFTPTSCAERTALFKAVAEGVTEFTDIAVVGSRRGEVNEQITSPCGVCRQALFEFGGPELNVIMAKTPEDFIERSMDELLPFGFGPSNVAGNRAVK
jgi:cytidine deaminase